MNIIRTIDLWIKKNPNHAELDEYSNQIIFMKNNNIETEEDLNSFSKTNCDEYENLMDKKESLWK